MQRREGQVHRRHACVHLRDTCSAEDGNRPFAATEFPAASVEEISRYFYSTREIELCIQRCSRARRFNVDCEIFFAEFLFSESSKEEKRERTILGLFESPFSYSSIGFLWGFPFVNI